MRLLHRCGTDHPEHRGDVDDVAAPRLDHVGSTQLRQVPDGRHVDLHRLAEPIEVLVLDRHLVTDPGVVHENSRHADLGHGAGHESFTILGLAEIGLHGDRARQLGLECLEALSSTRRQHDRGSGVVQDSGEVRTEPGRGSGHDGDPPVETEDVEGTTRRIRDGVIGHDGNITSDRAQCSDSMTSTSVR
ncbi:MAG: hypothetical protein RLZ86_1909 [Actinomycetota bacterium]